MMGDECRSKTLNQVGESHRREKESTTEAPRALGGENDFFAVWPAAAL
jgi:hypothetical protein